MHFIAHSKPTIGEGDIEAVTEVLRSGLVAQGEKVQKFEAALARFTGKRRAVAVSSGSAALHLSLLAIELPRGSSVAIPSYVCASPLHAVQHICGQPAVTDIEETNFGMDAHHLEDIIRKHSEKLTAIVPHMFGRIVDIDKLRSTSNVEFIVEDAAMAIGHPDIGKGDIVICSFYATKMMTTGEGGMVLSDDEELIDRVRDIRDYDKKDSHTARFNYKMTDFQAALGISQLSRLPQFLKRREEISELYGDKQEACYRYVVRSDNLERDLRMFQERGIECRKPVYRPVHEYLGHPDDDYPETSRAMREALSIPIHPSLTDDEVEYIAEAVEEIL